MKVICLKKLPYDPTLSFFTASADAEKFRIEFADLKFSAKVKLTKIVRQRHMIYSDGKLYQETVMQFNIYTVFI